MSSHISLPTTNQNVLNFKKDIYKCLGTTFSTNDDDEEESSPLIQTSTFLDVNDEIEQFLSRHKDHFTLFSMNADSLHAKHSYLQIFVEKLLVKGLFFSAICIQEARINKKTDCKFLDLPQYNLNPQPWVCSKKGGLVIYLHQNFTSTDRTSDLYKNSRIWEGQFIDVYGPSIKNKLTIANIYRPPRNNNNLKALTDFSNQLKPCLDKLKK